MPASPIAIARRDLIAEGKRADVALDFEGLAQEDGQVDMGSIARRSSGSWTVTVTGRSGHSSGIFAPAPAMARSTSWRGSSTRSAASCPRTS